MLVGFAQVVGNTAGGFYINLISLHDPHISGTHSSRTRKVARTKLFIMVRQPNHSASREGITAARAATRVEKTWRNSCYIIAHSVPVLVTAGAEKLPCK